MLVNHDGVKRPIILSAIAEEYIFAATAIAVSSVPSPSLPSLPPSTPPGSSST